MTLYVEPPVIQVADLVLMLQLRLPGLLGVGPEPCPAPLQPLAKKVDDALREISRMLAKSVVHHDQEWTDTVPPALSTLAAHISHIVGSEHPLSAQLQILDTYATAVAAREGP